MCSLHAFHAEFWMSPEGVSSLLADLSWSKTMLPQKRIMPGTHACTFLCSNPSSRGQKADLYDNHFLFFFFPFLFFSLSVFSWVCSLTCLALWPSELWHHGKGGDVKNETNSETAPWDVLWSNLLALGILVHNKTLTNQPTKHLIFRSIFFKPFPLQSQRV